MLAYIIVKNVMYYMITNFISFYFAGSGNKGIPVGRANKNSALQ